MAEEIYVVDVNCSSRETVQRKATAKEREQIAKTRAFWAEQDTVPDPPSMPERVAMVLAEAPELSEDTRRKLLEALNG